ncbi:MAG: Yip1 family protein [Steroidobacteraceae bacterium]
MNSLVQRVINLIKSPKSEWPVIAAEPATVGSIYVPYVLILAAIGPVATLLGGGGFGFMRLSSSFLFRMAIQQYAVSLISVAVLAFIINALAPTFGAQKDNVQAFKTAAYSYTAAWIAGIGALLGGLGLLITLAGGIYSLYTLYLGLPFTMKSPPEKSTGYTVVIIVCAIVLSIVLGVVMGSLLGTRAMMGGAGFGGFGGGSAPVVDEQVFDKDSPLGKLEQMGRDMEKAEKEGRTQDPSQAMGAVMGALAGSNGAVEALPIDTLKGFVPETLGGAARNSISAERNAMFGLQVGTATGRFGEGDRQMTLEIVDSGGAAGLMAMAGWAALEQSKEEGTRTERTGRDNGRMVHEVWDTATNSGEYSLVLANRFLVKVEGGASSLDDLRSAAGEIDLAKLESLRGEGVKN